MRLMSLKPVFKEPEDWKENTCRTILLRRTLSTLASMKTATVMTLVWKLRLQLEEVRFLMSRLIDEGLIDSDFFPNSELLRHFEITEAGRRYLAKVTPKEPSCLLPLSGKPTNCS